MEFLKFEWKFLHTNDIIRETLCDKFDIEDIRNSEILEYEEIL